MRLLLAQLSSLSLASLLTLAAAAVFSVPTNIHATYHLKGLGCVSLPRARPRSGPVRADPDPLSLARRRYNFRSSRATSTSTLLGLRGTSRGTASASSSSPPS